jgi:hypothetical protein
VSATFLLESGAPGRWQCAASVLIAFLFALSATGCTGYGLVRYQRPEGKKQRIALPTLDNQSSEPGLELLVSDALRREVLRRGAFDVVPRAADADWVLAGSVRPLEIRAQTVSSVVLALEYSVTLSLDLRLRPSDGKVVRLPVSALSESEIYLASADIEALRKNRLEALRRVSQLLAGRVHDVLDGEILE